MNDDAWYDLFEDVAAKIRFEPMTKHEQHKQLARIALAANPNYAASQDAGDIALGDEMYEVTIIHKHPTLKVGDVVKMVEAWKNINKLVRTDLTIHELADEHGQYVHLRRCA